MLLNLSSSILLKLKSRLVSNCLNTHNLRYDEDGGDRGINAGQVFDSRWYHHCSVTKQAQQLSRFRTATKGPCHGQTVALGSSRMEASH
eukprot:scaffold4343_cov144-Cylindrotheca_fusiformis.AAC.17